MMESAGQRSRIRQGAERSLIDRRRRVYNTTVTRALSQSISPTVLMNSSPARRRVITSVDDFMLSRRDVTVSHLLTTDCCAVLLREQRAVQPQGPLSRVGALSPSSL